MPGCQADGSFAYNVPDDSPNDEQPDESPFDRRFGLCEPFSTESDKPVDARPEQIQQHGQHYQKRGVIAESRANVQLYQADQHSRHSAAGAFKTGYQVKGAGDAKPRKRVKYGISAADREDDCAYYYDFFDPLTH